MSNEASEHVQGLPVGGANTERDQVQTPNDSSGKNGPRACGAVTKRGKPCPLRVDLCAACGRCWQHCEHRQDAAQERRRKATAASATTRAARRVIPEPPRSIVEAERLAAEALALVYAGQMTPSVGHVVARLVREFVQTRKAGDLADRLAKLEARLAQERARRINPSPEGA